MCAVRHCGRVPLTRTGCTGVTINVLKERLRQGSPVMGCMSKHPGASLVELLGRRGWDFVVIDAEHGPIDPLECEQMTRAAEVGGTTPIVRVPGTDRSSIGRFLDVGPRGLQVPMVESRDDAHAAVRYAKYSPDGARGLAGVRAAAYGGGASLAAYTEHANAELLVVVQVETAAAVERIDEIVTVPGVDVVFIGPTDLAQSLGVLGRPDQSLLCDATERIATAVLGSSKTLGVLATGEEEARRWISRGARYICFTIENVLTRGTANLLELTHSTSDRPPRVADSASRHG